MNKKLLLLLVTILMGSMTTVNAKINYIPLYIVDTQPDVKVVKHVPAAPLFITQDGYKLILPEFEDSLTLVVYKGNQEVFLYALQRQQSIVELPTTLVGDFEIRICTDTYYYFGYITLEGQNGQILHLKQKSLKFQQRQNIGETSHFMETTPHKRPC